MKLSVIAGLLLSLTGCASLYTPPSTSTEAESTAVRQSNSRMELGLGYLTQGDMIRARKNLEQALQHAPDYYRAQLSMAYYYETVGDTQTAAERYRQTLKQHPRNGQVLNNYGTFLCKQGKFDLADIYFNKALHQPDYYQVDATYENAAFCALKAGEKDHAAHYFQQALNHNPNRWRSLSQLTYLDLEQQHYSQARQRLLQFQDVWGVQPASLELLILVEEKAGNTAQKTTYQDQLLALNEPSPFNDH